MTRAALVAAFVLIAAAPADSTGEHAQWFRSLQQPGTGRSCCSIADCRPVLARIAKDHWEAFIDMRHFGPDAPQDWVRVADAHILRGMHSPLGEAVACWHVFHSSGVRDDAAGLMCFVPPPQT